VDITARKQTETALHESEEKYRSVITALNEGIVVHSVDGAIIACNPSAERILGLTEDQIRGKTPLDPRWQSVHEDGSPFPGETHPAMVTLRTGKPSNDVVMGISMPDSSMKWININSVPILISGTSALLAVIVSFADITLRKKAEQALREHETMLRSFFDSPNLMCGVLEIENGDARYISANRKLAEVLGQSETTLPGMSAKRLGASEHVLQSFIANCERSWQTGQPVTFEYNRVFATGERALLNSVSFLGTSRQGLPQFAVVILDVTENKKLERQLIEISEREQNRIGRELHDGVGQQLTALRYIGNAIRQKLLEQKSVAPEAYEQLDNMIGDIIKEVRNLARGLSPVGHDSHGLMHGLRTLCQNTKPLFGVDCEFECAAPVLVSDQAVSLNFFRIGQEALHNAVTHGAPKHIRLQLGQAAGRLRLVVRDDGHGLPKHGKKQGMGLEIMRYRAQSIGATLAIHSAPGTGVTITCELMDPKGGHHDAK